MTLSPHRPFRVLATVLFAALPLSCDDGKSWPVAITIEPDAAGYSTIAMLPDGDVGILYERGRYEYITFARITPRWPRSCG